MPRKAAMRTLSQISDINMTPLMDLTFLLLITFIITFPLVEQGIPVQLPKGKAAELPQRKTATLTLTKKGDLYLDKSILPLSEMESTLRELKRRHENLTVLVRADTSLAYGRVVELLRILHACQITQMALVTQGTE